MNIIVAIAQNNAIGKDNQLLWHISEDLKYFKRTTLGFTVVMGKNTFLSIGKPLPGRKNIVISSTLEETQGVDVFKSVETFLELYSNEENIFIIGGGALYKTLLPYCQTLYITYVHDIVDNADTFFPDINMDEWREVYKETHARGENFEKSFDFVVLKRAL